MSCCAPERWIPWPHNSSKGASDGGALDVLQSAVGDEKKLKRIAQFAACRQREAMNIPTAAGSQQLLVLFPHNMQDGEQIIRSVREQQTVLLHTGQAVNEDAQRLIDFACGGMEAIGGQVHRIDAETFLFAPVQAQIEWEDPPQPLAA